jgi:hypothetical protein
MTAPQSQSIIGKSRRPSTDAPRTDASESNAVGIGIAAYSGPDFDALPDAPDDAASTT